MAVQWKANTAELASRGGFDSDGDAAPAGIVLAQASRGDGESLPWLVADGRALPLREWADKWPLGRVGSLTELLECWPDHESDLRDLTTLTETRELVLARGDDIGSLLVQAPIQPRQTFCTIGNYVRQVVEAATYADDGADGPRAPARRASALEALHRRRRTGEPYVCLTSSERVGSPIGNLSIAPGVETLDWEVEIAVVFGAPARRISPGNAASVIAGYCVANDLTVRSLVVREDLPALGSDWIQSKGMPGSLPLGPWFVPAWQVPDTAQLRLRLSVNGIVMQDDTAEDMLFDIEHQIAYLSQHTGLRPGNVLCTGSPAGFGVHHGRFVRVGDVVSAQVSGLGEQRLLCVEEELPQARVTPQQATEKVHMR
ncbi:fumarylacetoacetate hydrolase family protein [Nocardia sp. NBC_01730]|uniref:fumarylacetoacetate hydrolase family protein n=1 Tax=Nocardia sp. NBC_01730 TaxID=2975998 RepID=UPI002E0D86A4|nr:fumarylacetoacetate hydrolase family protein [Nocardia sp. NBC_01730]